MGDAKQPNSISRAYRMPSSKVIFQEKGAKALNPQKRIDQSNFPFTMNVTIGCLFGCLYCYTQKFPFKLHADFGRETKVKLWAPKQLDKELMKFRNLPTHLKRVQVNESSEGYQPQVFTRTRREYGRDIMLETLQVFRNHWENGNRWMIHLLTKSHMITKHAEMLSQMREQVQVELTITTLDEDRRRILEGFAPSVGKRLRVIERLSQQGVFVRVMAMPFIGSKEEAAKLRDVVFDHGALGFKHKKMNYWDEEALLEGKLVGKGRRKDEIFRDLLVNSGEPVPSADGSPQVMDTVFPTEKWDDWVKKTVPAENCGYAAINDFDWGYLI